MYLIEFELFNSVLWKFEKYSIVAKDKGSCLDYINDLFPLSERIKPFSKKEDSLKILNELEEDFIIKKD